ncbi:class B sortase [Butyrivibrio proteoclasticus]|uniref:class B sortase n=1 Tax=Butyrivibrio proteoclasticus TaxID=43305 RepID=UPI000688D62C|nr:class B sortase [Butyrivibrio proteoclasticus]
MKKLIMWTKVFKNICRYKRIEWIALKRLVCIACILALLPGCSKKTEEPYRWEGIDKESASDSYIDFINLEKENEDIFGWIYVPEAGIDYPLVQSSEGDDEFYKTHNAGKNEDPKGAIYIEAANLNTMCDFNEVIHGSHPSDGTMFGNLDKFLDKEFFDETKYIYIYMNGNALVYYVIGAYTRDNTRLLEDYDFTYASGCQGFIHELCDGRSMNKLIREGWEVGLVPENFLVTLTTVNPDDPDRQIAVVGCLVGDVAGKIDRFVDYSDDEDYNLDLEDVPTDG